MAFFFIATVVIRTNKFTRHIRKSCYNATRVSREVTVRLTVRVTLTLTTARSEA